jgi:hypothetical protein
MASAPFRPEQHPRGTGGRFTEVNHSDADGVGLASGRQSDPSFPIESWQAAVARGETLLSYESWVAAQRDASTDGVDLGADLDFPIPYPDLVREGSDWDPEASDFPVHPDVLASFVTYGSPDWIAPDDPAASRDVSRLILADTHGMTDDEINDQFSAWYGTKRPYVMNDERLRFLMPTRSIRQAGDLLDCIGDYNDFSYDENENVLRVAEEYNCPVIVGRSNSPVVHMLARSPSEAYEMRDSLLKALAFGEVSLMRRQDGRILGVTAFWD